MLDAQENPMTTAGNTSCREVEEELFKHKMHRDSLRD